MSKKDDFIERVFRDGIQSISKEEIEDRGHEIEQAIEKLPVNMEQYRLYVELGEAYIKNNCDNGALRVFSGIIHDLCYSKEPESDGLWQRTCFGFYSLRNSDNGYVAEKAGEIFSEYL